MLNVYKSIALLTNLTLAPKDQPLAAVPHQKPIGKRLSLLGCARSVVILLHVLKVSLRER